MPQVIICDTTSGSYYEIEVTDPSTLAAIEKYKQASIDPLVRTETRCTRIWNRCFPCVALGSIAMSYLTGHLLYFFGTVALGGIVTFLGNEPKMSDQAAQDLIAIFQKNHYSGFNLIRSSSLKAKGCLDLRLTINEMA